MSLLFRKHRLYTSRDVVHRNIVHTVRNVLPEEEEGRGREARKVRIFYSLAIYFHLLFSRQRVLNIINTTHIYGAKLIIGFFCVYTYYKSCVRLPTTLACFRSWTLIPTFTIPYIKSYTNKTCRSSQRKARIRVLRSSASGTNIYVYLLVCVRVNYMRVCVGPLSKYRPVGIRYIQTDSKIDV